MFYLVRHAAVRMQPLSSSRRWRVTNLSTKQTYDFSTIAIMVLIALIGGSETQTAADHIQERCTPTNEVVGDAIDLLGKLGHLQP